MKSLSAFAFGIICVGISAGQQIPSADATLPAANETKGLVQGIVVQEPGGEGIPGVLVTLTNYSATTDERGQFKIEGMKLGCYYMVYLSRSGYVANGKTNREKWVKAGQDTKDIVLHMAAAGGIGGRILDAEGHPMRNVSVEAVTAKSDGGAGRNWASRGDGITNELGEYQIANLSPGKYIVQTRPEYPAPLPSAGDKGTRKGRLVYAKTYFPGTLDEHQAVMVEVPPGGSATANFGVQAGHAYRVSGAVAGLRLGGQRERKAELFLEGESEPDEQPDLTESGKFEFPTVLEGTYHARLIVFEEQKSNWVPLVNQTIGTPIEVNGADVVGLKLQVDMGGDVSGKFRAEGGEKIDWSQLYVNLLAVPKNEEEAAVVRGAQVKQDGSFQIKDVPGSNYQLAVNVPSEEFRDYYTKSVLLGGSEVVDTGFAVSSGTVLDVVVSTKGAEIEGTVVDGDGKPVDGAKVVTVPSSRELGRPNAYQFGETDENGHFLLCGLNPGGFLVLAFEEMPENVRAPEFAQKYEGKGEQVELEQGRMKNAVLKLIKED
jgi:hypothetical protein